MLAAAKVEETRRLLDEGKLSQRGIARLLGVSRATVSAIAKGKRPDYEARRLLRIDEDEPLGPLERCPGCGGMVYTPCRLCHVRKLKAREEQAAKAFRRRAREQSVKRLLAMVAEINRKREGGGDPCAKSDSMAASHFPFAAGGASDCR